MESVDGGDGKEKGVEVGVGKSGGGGHHYAY